MSHTSQLQGHEFISDTKYEMNFQSLTHIQESYVVAMYKNQIYELMKNKLDELNKFGLTIHVIFV